MNKSIVVLDTNIYISATFWSGEPYLIVQKAVKQEIVVFISEAIVKELRKVLARDFSIDKKGIGEVVKAVLLFAHLIESKEKASVIKDDPDDDRILECALACKADFIVTRDTHLLEFKNFKGIKIVTPKELLDLIKK